MVGEARRGLQQQRVAGMQVDVSYLAANQRAAAMHGDHGCVENGPKAGLAHALARKRRAGRNDGLDDLAVS